MTNGFFLQKETVPQIKQDLIDLIYNNLYLERRQANYLLLLKKWEYEFKRAKTKYYANNVRDGSVWQGFLIYRESLKKSTYLALSQLS